MIRQVIRVGVLAQILAVGGVLGAYIEDSIFSVARDTSGYSCPTDLPYSCTNSTPVNNACCFESPGGILLQTQFWDYSPAVGGDTSFTLHGLWPDNCDGSYAQYCAGTAQISSAKDIILNDFNDETLYQKMSEYWKNNNGDDDELWVHEYNKHGTCINTLKPKCYGDSYVQYENVHDFYTITVNLYEKLNTYLFLSAEGITPSTSKTYTKTQIANALEKHFGKTVYFKCDSNNALLEVWYYHHLKGGLRGENFEPINTIVLPKCPSSGIKFEPKQ